MVSYSEAKLKNLVLYICTKCEPKELGSTKLNKVLWYADTSAYTYRGTPITGETYVKRQYGPVPKHILSILTDLEESKQIVTRNVDYFGHDKKEFFALKKPDLSEFTGEEVSLIDTMIEIICRENTAKAISDASHDRIWELADIGEEIPYHAVLASHDGEIDDEDVKWAKKSGRAQKAA